MPKKDETRPPARMPGQIVTDDGGRPEVDDGGRPIVDPAPGPTTPAEPTAADAVDAAEPKRRPRKRT